MFYATDSYKKNSRGIASSPLYKILVAASPAENSLLKGRLLHPSPGRKGEAGLSKTAITVDGTLVGVSPLPNF